MVEQLISFIDHIPELQQELQDILEMIQLQSNQNKEVNPLYCQACKIALGKVYNWDKIEIKLTNFITLSVTYACSEQYNWFPLNVCYAFSNQQIPAITEALWEHYFNPKFLCSLLTLCKRKLQITDIDAYIQDIMKDKPQNQEQIVPSQKNVVKMLHITDIHVDQKYEENTISTCTDPECCRQGSEPRDGKSEKSGYWGSLAWCDIPYRTLQQGIDFIQQQIPGIDFAIWTGDNTSLNVLEQTQEQNMDNTKQITEILQKTLPDITFYPIFGNFEIYPINLYNFDGKSEEEKQLKQDLSEIWQSWIGESASKMLENDGFYTTVIEKYNLKLIALNTQAADSENFTLIQNPTDPGTMLEQLRKSLQESEDNNNQAVWIYSHIPVGRGTRDIWSKVYNAIIDRYSYIIRAQFNGHTHTDEIGLFYDQEGNINNIRFVAPSFTTYFNRKPSFRVFEFDSETLQVLNYYQYRLDLDYWNQFTDPNTQIQWEVAYDFLSEYKIKNMWDLNNFQDFRDNVSKDLNIYNKYVYNHQSGVGNQDFTEINQKYQCQMLTQKQLQDECQGKKYKPYILDWIAGPWTEKIPKKFLK